MGIRFIPHENWFTELEMNYKGSMFNDDNNQIKRPGYASWNVAMGYQTQSINLTLAITNLLNKEYWRSSSIPSTPRAFILTASYKL